MANLEFANLFSPANNASGAAIAAGAAAAVAVDDPALARNPSFSQLLQAGATREPATGATIVGLAGLPAILNSAGMPAANQPRALRPDSAAVAPADPGIPSLDLPATAALLLEGLMPGAETGEMGDSKDSSADAEPVDLEDPADGSAPAVVQWPGLPLFMEARAALRNDSSAGRQPEQAASVTGIESARWSFMLRSAGAGQLAGDGHAPASLTPATPEISTPEISTPGISSPEVTVDSPRPLAGEGLGVRVVDSTTDPLTLTLSPLAGGEGVERLLPEIPATDAAKLTAAIAETEGLPAQTESESPEPGAFNAPLPANPVAQLATGRTDQTAPTMPPDQPEPADSASLHLRNPVAQLATGRTDQTAPTMPPDQSEPTDPASLHLRNPVAALATSARPERIEAGPVNPVASLATAARPERIEAGSVNPVASLATAARPERIEAGSVNPVASLATAGQSGQPSETTTVDTSEATTPELSPPTDGRPFSPQPLIAPPFAEAGPEIALEAIPHSAEPIAPAPAGSARSAPQSPLTPARPDPATAPTSLPATPDVVDLNQKNWGKALGHQLNWMVNNQLQQAEIRVNPPDLGPIELRVSLQHNQTSVTFFCHESAVREALENALPRLREMLDSQGISLNQAQVSDQSLARQQAGGGQPSFSQRDDRPPATPIQQEPVADETEPRPQARRLPGTVDDYV